MQHRLLSILLLSGLILMHLGCDQKKATKGTDQVSNAKDVVKEDASAPEVPVVVVPVAGPEAMPIDPFTPPPIPGGGGGSQGAIKPARTGNPDASGFNAQCGNGIQEPLNRVGSCPYDLYGTDNQEGGAFLLGFKLGLQGAPSFSQEIISTNTRCSQVYRINALDFSPDGTLYGVGRANCDNQTATYLFKIDCQTGGATLIEELNDIRSMATNLNTLDIDFDSHGRLYAYSGAMAGNELGTYNIVSGAYTLIGPSGLSDFQSGLASFAFPDPNFLFQINLNLNRLDIGDGHIIPYNSVIFPAGLNPGVEAMDADSKTGVIYINLSLNNLNYVAVYDRNTNTASFLNPGSPVVAPAGFTALTVNRTYEECDGTDFELPPYTTCSNSCELIETNCGDYVFTDNIGNAIPVDNNYDGLANCDDPSCLNQQCNDLNGCTTNDTCIAPTLFPMPISCENSSECGPLGECTDGGICFCQNDAQCPVDTFCRRGNCSVEEQIVCDTSDDCPADASCQNGICALPVICEGTNISSIPIADGGCLDDNECTTDTCQRNTEIPPYDLYSCRYSLNQGKTEIGDCTPAGNCAVELDPDGSCPCAVPLNPDGSCPLVNVSDLCVLGTCIQPGVVTCATSLECVGTQPGTCSDGVCTCLTNLQCPSGRICDSGTCQYTPTCEATDRVDVLVEDGGCDDENQCTVNICDQEFDNLGLLTFDCLNGAIEAAAPCTVDGEACAVGHCEDGLCIDLVDLPAACITNADCGPSLNCVANVCACDTGNDCLINESCDGEGSCTGAPTLPGTECSSSPNSCTDDACDISGTCVVGPTVDANCGVETLCLVPICTETGCDNVVINGFVTCEICSGPDCVLGTLECINGSEGSCVAIDPTI